MDAVERHFLPERVKDVDAVTSNRSLTNHRNRSHGYPVNDQQLADRKTNAWLPGTSLLGSVFKGLKRHVGLALYLPFPAIHLRVGSCGAVHRVHKFQESGPVIAAGRKKNLVSVPAGSMWCTGSKWTHSCCVVPQFLSNRLRDKLCHVSRAEWGGMSVHVAPGTYSRSLRLLVRKRQAWIISWRRVAFKSDCGRNLSRGSDRRILHPPRCW